MSETTVLSEIEAGVAKITLNRPDALNAWTGELGKDLHAALRSARDDEAVRSVLITGVGRAFSSGADLSQQPKVTPEGKADLRAALVEIYNPIILEVREMPKPVVAAVNGAAVGIGCSLALACDLVVAAESGYFLLAFANVGLTLDGGASAFLAARIGHARSVELAMLAERLPAPTALEWGLINRVVPDGDLASEADALASRLARGATRSYAASKELLNQQLYPDLAAQLEREANAQQGQAETEDFLEGVVSFLQKREAEFKGR